MQRIFVVRHGQSVGNAHKIVVGQNDSPLTQLGHEQARQAGEQARQLRIDYIVCSPLKRAHDTARIIAGIIHYPPAHIVVMPELKERYLASLQGASYATDEQDSGNYPIADTIPNVESLQHLHTRVQHALHTILQHKEHRNVLIVCHMGIVRMLKVIAAGKDASAFYDMPHTNNACIEELY